MNILVIKHGALGDFVMASGAMKSIRKHFAKDNILLLTEEKNINFFKLIPYFNSFKKDNRKSIFFSIFTILNIVFFKLFQKILKVK